MTDYPWLAHYPDGVDYHARFEPAPLWRLLDEAVETYADHNFLDFMGRHFSYREVGYHVAKAAKGFQKLGVKPGVKVGLFLPNCPQYVIAFFGILKAGGTVVNFSPLYSESELLQQIEDSGTTIMVTLNHIGLYPKMEAIREKSPLEKLVIGSITDALPFPKNLLYPVLRWSEIVHVPNDGAHVAYRELLNNDSKYTPVVVDTTDTAVLQYTGGTTGQPKGAMLSHGSMYINAKQAATWSPSVELGEEVVLAVLPFFHVFAMTVIMNLGMTIGAELIIHPNFDPGMVLKDIKKKGVTLMAGVPTMYMALLKHPDLDADSLTSLKRCNSGGAPLPADVKSQFEDLSGCKLVEGYGLTECAAVATINPFEGMQKEGSIGLPMPGTRIVITDREDPHKVLPLGEIGEICLEGPQLMTGYWGREEATREAIVDGRLRTGDLGYLDEDGFTFIVDRMKDMILVGGFNVYPRFVEEAIYQHPAVDEATVIGIPDDYLGEIPKAFVKLRAGHEDLTREALVEFLSEHLAKHEVPRNLEFRDELPKTPVGKLSKKELVAEEAAKRAAAS